MSADKTNMPMSGFIETIYAPHKRDSKLKNPRYMQGLAIPTTDRNIKEMMHFYNFTYPFDDFSEIRDPIELRARPNHLFALHTEERTLLAVIFEEGIQVFDPSGTFDRFYAAQLPDGAYFNGCATIDDFLVASARGIGLYEGRMTGKNLTPWVNTDCPGKVQNIDQELEKKKNLMYAEKNEVREFTHEENRINITAKYRLDSSEITNFTAIRPRPVNAPQKKLVIASAHDNNIYRLDNGEQELYKMKVIRSKSGRPYIPSMSFEFFRGEIHLLIAQPECIVDMKYNTEANTFENPSEISLDNKLLHVKKYTADFQGGVFILANRRISEQKSVINYLLRPSQDRTIAKLKLDSLSKATQPTALAVRYGIRYE